MSLIRDLTDDEARAALVLKWGETEPGVIPAWVAEMDYAVAEPITAAVRDGGRARRARLPGVPAVAAARSAQAYAGFARAPLRLAGAGRTGCCRPPT